MRARWGGSAIGAAFSWGMLALLLARPLEAQQGGRIVGRVVDAQSGAGVANAVVEVVGTRARVASGIDGRYLLPDVEAGTVSVRASMLGYGAKTVAGIVVAEGATVELTIALQVEAVQLEAIEVSAGAERGSVARALDQQRTATGVVSAVTAEQISKSPDSDAAEAVRRVSGVTVQDGKYIFVRGLGERYTTASLNGARIPSPEPERKVVPLDLFPAGLLQTITTSKTFTPDQPGDFSGAQVDIRTREFPARREVAYSASVGYNARVTGSKHLAAPTAGAEWLGFGGTERSVPAPVARAGDLEPPPTQGEINRMVGSFRNAWSVRQRTAAPNGSVGVSMGGSAPLLTSGVGYLLSASYGMSQEVRADERRAVALATGNGAVTEVDRFEGETGRSSVQWGGLLNLSTLLGGTTRLALNNSYNRTADNEARREQGYSENLGGSLFQIDRLRYVERSVRSNQLVLERQLGSRHQLEWSLTSSGVRRREPDRSEIVYASDADPATGQPLAPAWFSVSNEGAVRTFGDLTEQSFEGAAHYRLTLGAPERAHLLRFGALARSTTRDADNRAYSISARLDRAQRELAPEQLFDGRFAGEGSDYFRLTSLRAGGSYQASDRLYAGYGMVDLALAERVRLVGGARLERSEVAVDAEPTIGAPVHSAPAYTDLLPALALNLKLTEGQNLRVSLSQTLSRPEYRELAGIQYREVIGGENVIGNPALRRTLVRNADLRWEWYPGAGEVLSVALFAKRFQDPIERIYLATSGTRIVTFVNAEGAENYGVELEVRKSLGTLAKALAPLTLAANTTLMKSEIRIGSGMASKTNDQRAMVGQAPYVFNTSLTYASAEGRASATLLYNVVGRRIASASEAPLPDVVEEPRHALDLALRFPLRGGISAKIDARNLLDSPAEVRQGGVVREFYRTGRSVSFGVSVRP